MFWDKPTNFNYNKGQINSSTVNDGLMLISLLYTKMPKKFCVNLPSTIGQLMSAMLLPKEPHVSVMSSGIQTSDIAYQSSLMDNHSGMIPHSYTHTARLLQQWTSSSSLTRDKILKQKESRTGDLSSFFTQTGSWTQLYIPQVKVSTER